MRRPVLIAIAALLALVGTSLAAYQWMSRPTFLRVAVGPIGSDDTRLIAAMTQYLEREREGVRLKLVMTDGLAASAQAIDQGSADVAVVRTDVAMPGKGQTVAIMHRDAALLVTTSGKDLSEITDLSKRRIGIIRRQTANTLLLEAVLAHYEIRKDSVTIVPLAAPAEAEEALRSGRVDLVLAVGALGSATLNDTVAAVTRAGGGPPVFIPVNEAAAIAQRSPLFDSFEVVRGAFGGSPPRPAETFTTVGVSHRLVAQTRLDQDTVSELTRLIFAMRPTIAAEVALANRIEEPDTSKASALPVHHGAADYYAGTVQTFFERYGDWFYLGVMVVSILGSAAAGLAGAASGRSRNRTMELLDGLLAIIQRARIAESEPELQVLEAEADAILATALAKAAQNGVDQTGMMAMFLGLDQARRAIHEQRLILEHRTADMAAAAE